MAPSCSSWEATAASCWGCLLGFRRPGSAPVGLIYVDAHSDFATPETSRTGSVASMCLALAVGRGDTPLAHLEGNEPPARAGDVVIIGRRDDADAPWYGQDVLQASPILDIPDAAFRERGPGAAARLALERVTRPDLGGFWIQLVRHSAALGLELTIYDPALDPDRSSAAWLATLLEAVLEGAMAES